MRYWLIAPHLSTAAAEFDSAWSYDLGNGTVAIGFREEGDVSKLKSIEDVRAHCRGVWPKRHRATVTKIANALWNFYHEIRPGDRLIARRGRNKIVGVGTVQGVGYRDEHQGLDRVPNHRPPMANFLSVDWRPCYIDFGRITFDFFTLRELAESEFASLTKGCGNPP